MPELATLHSGRAVGLVGTDQIAKVTNLGDAEVYLGTDPNADDHERQLAPGDSAVLKGPLSGLAYTPTNVQVESDPDALRADAEQAKPKKKPAAKKAASPKTRKR